VEIGFGMGLATAQIAENNPDTLFLCTEVFTAGVGKLLGEIERRQLQNVAIIQHDAVDIFTYMIPDNSLSGVHLFFPDPWPKKKHHKRRLLQEPFLRLLSHKLKDKGYLYFVTDWEEYAFSVLHLINESAFFRNSYEGFAPPADWRPTTRFEEKAQEKGHRIYEVRSIKSIKK
jgi:tRNA (guanine-N7-)-methyltransferase